MDNTEYETQWNEGEEPGPITDAVLKAKRKERLDRMSDEDKEYEAAYNKDDEESKA